MAPSYSLSRRTMLRGMGAAIALPLLEVMPDSQARASEPDLPPRRLAYLYIPNGVADGAWHPKRVGRDGQIEELNGWMSSLEPFADQLTLFRNLWTPRGNGHIAGTATWLTGGAFDDESIDAGNASVDQIAAQHFASETLLPSLELSSRGEGFFSSSLPRNSISWVDRRTPAPRDIEPRVVFDRMFRVGSSRLSDRSVLDLVLEDAHGLSRRVSQQDQHKVEEYLESIRAIERRLEFAEQQRDRARRSEELSAALVRPRLGIPDDHGEYMRTMLDMIVLAFWADATRVCTFMMDHGQSNRYFNFIDGVQGTWHALSHWKDVSGRTEDDDGITSWSSRDVKREMYNQVTAWHTELVGYFLNRLNSIEERGASLLDNSMIVYGSSLADGHEHAEKNLPILLAGGGGGTIRGGRVLGGRHDTSMSDLHLALLQRLGVEQTRFAESRSPLELG